MLLIADSGSTKTQWLSEDGKLYETPGINPMFQNSDQILAILNANDKLRHDAHLFSDVKFFGASCSAEDRKRIVRDALLQFFNEVPVTIDHDLKAAAYSTYDDRPCISCIVGTGSNSCFFDGTDVYQPVPALGYVLGDEAGGAYFGKKLLSLFLYGQLPAGTSAVLENKYSLTKEKIFDAVYRQPSANVYLAGFARVLSESPDKEFIEQIVSEGFREFFRYHICCFENYRQVPVHFVGSIALNFREVLLKVCAEFGCELGEVNNKPVYGLQRWFLHKK